MDSTELLHSLDQLGAEPALAGPASPFSDASIGTTQDADPNVDPVHDRFWLVQTRLALSVTLAETAIVMTYLAATPHVAHRVAIWILALSCFALAVISFFVLVPIQTRKKWRETFSLGWSVATCLIVASVTALDGGLTSPLRSLLVVPVAFAGLMFPPAAVAITASTAIVGASIVSALDPHVSTEWPGLLIDFSVLISISTISFAAALGRARMLRETERLTSELAQLATIDPLTGCLNRRAFDEECRAELARSIRYRRSLAYVMIDLDNLKRINDTGGHAAGDRALAFVGKTLRETSRSSDLVARLGGDEFAVLIPDGDAEGMIDLARRVSAVLSSGSDDPLTLSYGGTTFENPTSTLASLLEEADHALYEAKRAGRNRIVVYSGIGSTSTTLEIDQPPNRPDLPKRLAGPSSAAARAS